MPEPLNQDLSTRTQTHRQRLEVRAIRIGWVLSVVGFLVCFGLCLSTGQSKNWQLVVFMICVGIGALVRMVRSAT